METGEQDQMSLEVEKQSELHILGIEDDASLRLLQGILFKKIGIDYESAADGQNALKVIQENPNRFNAIFTDYDMPGMNGVELAQKAKEINPNFVITLITGRKLEDAELNELRAKGVDLYLQKPFLIDDLNVLTEKVKSILSEKKDNEI